MVLKGICILFWYECSVGIVLISDLPIKLVYSCRYLDLVCKKYSDSIEGYFKGEKKQHKCIAALICDQVGEHPFIATFAAGTRHNDEQMCYSSAPCSMHAESLCYDAAPIFFQLEMSNCLKGNTSIFSFNENDKYFELKLDIEFHLLITEPPCGWIQQRKKPFIEWMESSVTVSHVPTCSSKIFINSKLGIQGSVSHLLTAPIFVDSVIILHDKSIEDVALKTNFDPEGNFRLPNVVLLEYDPKMLSGIEKTFMPMNLIYKYIQKSAASDISADSTQRETTKQKESDISADSTQQETTEQKTTKQKAGKGDYNKGFVHIEHSDGRRGRLFQLISKHTKKDKDSGPTVETITKIEDCGLTITEQMVLEGLQQAVDEKFQAERKDDMKQMYIDLTRSYGQDAIDCKLRELQRKIDSLEKTIKDSKDVFQEPISFYPSSEFDEHMTKLKKKWEIIQMNGKKICDYYCMTENINQSWKPDTIGVQNCITIDCSWQKYFNNAFSSSVQPDS